MLRDIAPVFAVCATVAVVLLAGVAIWLVLGQRRLRAGQRVVLGPHGQRDLVEHAESLEEQVRNLRDAVEMLTGSVEDYRHDLDGSLSNLAVVRFDAFRDTGGHQSAALALLDNYRSGVVISIIASREFARLYVKHIDHGVPDRELSPEEEEAMRQAVPSPLARDAVSGPNVPTLPRRLDGVTLARPPAAVVTTDELEAAEEAREEAVTDNAAGVAAGERDAIGAASGVSAAAETAAAADGTATAAGDGTQPAAPAGYAQASTEGTGKAEAQLRGDEREF